MHSCQSGVLCFGLLKSCGWLVCVCVGCDLVSPEVVVVGFVWTLSEFLGGVFQRGVIRSFL